MAKMSKAPNRLKQLGLGPRAGTRQVYFLICSGKIYLVAEWGRLFASLVVRVHKSVCIHELSIAHGVHLARWEESTAGQALYCWSITSVSGGGVNRKKARLAGTSRSMWSKSNSIVLWSGRLTTRRRISN